MQMKECWYSIYYVVWETMAVCAACLPVNRQQDGTMWVILSESQDNRKRKILWQMDDRSAGVGEGQDGRERDTKPSTPTGRESTISQGAKPCSPAKARPRQMRGAACGSHGGHGDSRWGSGEDHLLALTAWGWLRLRVMGNCDLLIHQQLDY